MFLARLCYLFSACVRPPLFRELSCWGFHAYSIPGWGWSGPSLSDEVL